MTKKIHPRDGIDVYQNKSGTITIEQITTYDTETDNRVVVHPDDIPQLIILLEEARREALENPSADEEE